MQLIGVFDRNDNANGLADKYQKAADQGLSRLGAHVGLIALVVCFDVLSSRAFYLVVRELGADSFF